MSVGSVTIPTGYALNKLFHSLNNADNRRSFLADEDAYCARYGLSEAERAAVRSGDKRQIKAAGGNQYYIAKYDRTLRLSGDPRRREVPANDAAPGARPAAGEE